MRVAVANIGVAAFVLALKLVAAWTTGSVALLADALETVVNLAAAIGTLAVLRYARRPADANHPYGHAKAEHLAAVLEGAVILGAAVLIGVEAWRAFAQPQAPALPLWGLGVAVVATGVNAAWAVVLHRRGSAARSPVLLAEAAHLRTDVATSVAMLAGLGAVAATGWLWLDPAFALVAVGLILWAGVGVVGRSLGGLMDAAVPPETLARIHAVLANTAEGAIEAHALRSRQAGPVTFIEFHLVVPGTMQVAAAHVICDRLEAALQAAIPGAVVTIHVETEAQAERHAIRLA